MPIDSIAQRSYDVAVEEAELKYQQLGPLFARYSLRLTGRVDALWSNQYQRITKDSPSFGRYQLDPKGSTVSFTCRATDGPVEVMSVVKRLDELLDVVNERASAAGSPEGGRESGTPMQYRESRAK